MDRINFADKYLLTEKFLRGRLSLVLGEAVDPEGKRAVTRDGNGRVFRFDDGTEVKSRYLEGQSLGVMMRYADCGLPRDVFGDLGGWKDKRKTVGKYLPNRAIITRVRCIRVSELTEEEMIRGGVEPAGQQWQVGGAVGGAERTVLDAFRRLYSAQFKVPWSYDPWVVVYEFVPVLARGLQGGVA